MVFLQLLFIFLAYFIGCIPFGYIIGKIKGVDLTKEGSGNIGATNCGRVLGKKYAVLVFLLDVFKGFIFVFLFRFKFISPQIMVISPLLYGFLAAVGHSYSIFLNFKGGKAVATSCGMILGFSPTLFLLIFVVFMIVKKVSKLVSLGSLIATITTVLGFVAFLIIGYDPTLTFLSGTWIFPVNTFQVDIETFIIAILCASLIFIKHSSNIKRIKDGTEKPINY